MSLSGGKPASPAPHPGMPVVPASKWSSKPAPQPVAKPGLFEGGRQAPIKDLFRQAKNPTVVPGTGGQKIFKQEHQELLKKYLPYKQVGAYLKPDEAKIVLRRMRKEDKGVPSRDRRTLEQDFGLKGKY